MARTIAGELTLPDGSPLANAAIHFTAKRTEAVRILEDVSSFFTTSSTGAYSQDVESGYYAVSVSYAAVPGTQPRRWHLGDVWVEDGDPISLTALLALNNSAADPTDSALRQLLADAQAARDEAQAAAQEAEQYRDETASMLDSKIDESEKGEPGGVATLDSGGRVPAAQLPSYVDDVEEYANYAALPTPGEAGKIYITIDNNRQYRWGGSGYIELVASPGTTDNVPEGSSNLYHTAARVRAVALAGISFASSAAITASDTILSAFGKIQAKLNTLKGMAFLDKATQAQAEEGVSDIVGMTPARTRNAYTQWGLGVVNPPTLTMAYAWGNRVFRVDGEDPSNPLDRALTGINLNITGHDWGGQILLDHNLSFGTLMYRPKSGGVFGPLRTVWDSINLPQSSINNWNTAYGWGDYRQFGIGVPEGQSPAEVTDVDAAKTSGNFRLPGNASGGHPFPGVSSSLRLEKASSSFITQWATRGGSDSSFSNTRAKIRRFNGTEWLPWAEVWTSANLPNIQSATPANGGLLVDNQKTGTGLERVLTESDLGGGGSGESYESVAAFIASTPSANAANIISYYPGWSGTVEGPKGGFTAHRTGYTAASPSVGNPVTPSTIGTGEQAGLFWTADGVEWKLTEGQTVKPETLGARGDLSAPDTQAVKDLFSLTGRYDKRGQRGSRYLIDSPITDAVGIVDMDFAELVPAPALQTYILDLDGEEDFTGWHFVFNGNGQVCAAHRFLNCNNVHLKRPVYKNITTPVALGDTTMALLDSCSGSTITDYTVEGCDARELVSQQGCTGCRVKRGRYVGLNYGRAAVMSHGSGNRTDGMDIDTIEQSPRGLQNISEVIYCNGEADSVYAGIDVSSSPGLDLLKFSRGSVNCRIYRAEALDCGRDGIRVQGSPDCKIVNCNVTAKGGVGLNIFPHRDTETTSHNLQVTGGRFEATAGSAVEIRGQDQEFIGRAENILLDSATFVGTSRAVNFLSIPIESIRITNCHLQAGFRCVNVDSDFGMPSRFEMSGGSARISTTSGSGCAIRLVNGSAGSPYPRTEYIVASVTVFGDSSNEWLRIGTTSEPVGTAAVVGNTHFDGNMAVNAVSRTVDGNIPF